MPAAALQSLKPILSDHGMTASIEKGMVQLRGLCRRAPGGCSSDLIYKSLEQAIRNKQSNRAQELFDSLHITLDEDHAIRDAVSLMQTRSLGDQISVLEPPPLDLGRNFVNFVLKHMPSLPQNNYQTQALLLDTLQLSYRLELPAFKDIVEILSSHQDHIIYTELSSMFESISQKGDKSFESAFFETLTTFKGPMATERMLERIAEADREAAELEHQILNNPHQELEPTDEIDLGRSHYSDSEEEREIAQRIRDFLNADSDEE